jgi:hypothetical protein
MARRLLEAAGVLVLTLLVLEGALQLAGLLVPRLLTRAVEPSGDGLRILCVGDSHTYGAGAALVESYPRLLQEDLARRHPGRRFEVLNLGVPGMNSAQVANRIEGWIGELDPDLVIVWVGVNNPWNATEMADRSALWRLLMASRLFRLAAVAWEKAPPPALTREQRQAAGRGRGEPFVRREADLPWAEALRSLDRDLARIATLTRARRLPLLFLNYPYAFDDELRSAIRAAGERLAVPVVDTLADAKRAQADGVRPIFVWGAGFHPTGALNRYIAASVTEATELALGLAPDRDESDRRPP